MAKQNQGQSSGSQRRAKAPARNQKGMFTVLGLIAAAFAVFIVYQMNKPTGQEAVTIDPGTPLPTAAGYTMGSPDAPVKVIEFADFECPACAQFFTLTEPDVRARLVETGQVSYTFMDFPLPMHPNTWPASNAAACANEQGKFWEYHDILFQMQDQWSGFATRRPGGKFKEFAQQVGLDVGKWESCFDAQKYNLNIKAHEQEAVKRGAGQTPTFIIGNRRVPGSISFDKFKAYVDTALAEAGPQALPSQGDTAQRPSVNVVPEKKGTP
ncbi:MAG: DsbA family protein [Gemmatimonadetes bacterium]|nr:DsbA family protein [Gemmatimonadota bacterium]